MDALSLLRVAVVRQSWVPAGDVACQGCQPSRDKLRAPGKPLPPGARVSGDYKSSARNANNASSQSAMMANAAAGNLVGSVTDEAAGQRIKIAGGSQWRQPVRC